MTKKIQQITYLTRLSVKINKLSSFILLGLLLLFCANTALNVKAQTNTPVYNTAGECASLFSNKDAYQRCITQNANPASYTPTASSACTQSQLTLIDIFVPTKFTPIIETQCAVDASGRAKPLSFDSIPYILVRAYGFISALVVYLFGFIIIFSGIQYSYGALDGKQSVQALRNLQDSIVALLLVFSAYAIVNTLVIVLKVPGTVSGASIGSFFTKIN